VITSGAAGSVDENANISTVVYDANATDQDTADTITYTLGGVDAAAFDINGSSGAVTLKAPADFETKASYSIDVIATDNGTGTLADTQAVTISITNVNEPRSSPATAATQPPASTPPRTRPSSPPSPLPTLMPAIPSLYHFRRSGSVTVRC